MLQYIVKRLLSTIPVLIGISLLLFFMLRMLPGDPAQVLAGQMASPEEVENIRNQLGLNEPIYVQYGKFLTRLVQFDLGRSARTQNPVTQEVWARLPNTTNISFPGANGDAILARLDDLGIYVSTGSACNSAAHETSPVLQAMNVPYANAMGSIRFSLGRFNTEEEVETVLDVFPPIISELRSIAA